MDSFESRMSPRFLAELKKKKKKKKKGGGGGGSCYESQE